MQAVIRYLRSPAVQSVLARLSAIAPGGCRISPSWAHDIRRAAKLLGARARLRHAGAGDVDAAIDDLLAAFRLAAFCYNSGDLLVILTAAVCEDLAHRELQCMAFERQLTRAQAERIIRAAQAMLPDARDLWRLKTAAMIEALQRALDSSYTLDEDGNGWLVLSYGIQGRAPGPPRFGAWNVFSPLFNNRRAVAEKVEFVRRAYEAVSSMPFAAAQSRMERLELESAFNILDGPVFGASSTRYAASTHFGYTAMVARRRATLVGAGLAAFRREHGAYPESLSELVGDYLVAVPRDPFDGEPIRYLRTADADDYMLYCVGRNQVDDGGKPRKRSASGMLIKDDGDMIFDHKRWGTLYSEVSLEKITP